MSDSVNKLLKEARDNIERSGHFSPQESVQQQPVQSPGPVVKAKIDDQGVLRINTQWIGIAQ